MSQHVRDYVRRFYGVPADVGVRVAYTYQGRRDGTIVGFDDEGAYLLVRLDGEETVGRYHPTWEIEYLVSERSTRQEVTA